MVHQSSDKIRVFPSSNRTDTYDRNARLNTEHNIVSIVNRLTNSQSFVIDGLTVSANGNKVTIEKGSCNIYGYYFELDTVTDVVMGNNSDLYLYIILKSLSINNEDSAFSTIQELDGKDESAEYKGLYISTALPTSGNYKYLKLASKDAIGNITNFNNTIISTRLFAIDEGNLSKLSN